MNATLIDTKRGPQVTDIETEKVAVTVWSWHLDGGWAGVTNDPTATEIVAGIPASMIDSYSLEAAIHARVEEMEDGDYFADVVGLDGVWGSGPTENDALEDLRFSIKAWVELKLARSAHVPVLGAIDLNPRLEQAS